MVCGPIRLLPCMGRHEFFALVAATSSGLAKTQLAPGSTLPGFGFGQTSPLVLGSSALGREEPWDSPSVVQPVQQQHQQQLQQHEYVQQQPQWWDQQQTRQEGLWGTSASGHPLVIGGIEFSREDDIGNMEKLSNVFGQIFYTLVLRPGDDSIQQAWNSLSSDIWTLVEYSAQVPALALAVAMCLYNYFWWEGPHNVEPNVDAGYRAAELMYVAVTHARCNDPALPGMEFFISQCHLRWRYVVMLAGEVARHLLLQRRDLRLGARVILRLRSFFHEMRQLPHAGLLQGGSPYEVNFNGDYFPSSVLQHGPVWKHPVRDLPIAGFLEANYVTIRKELDAILAAGGTFRELDEATRNAETQFGPRGDDWMTAYMFRKGEAIEAVCRHAPKTCALLATRSEVAGCRMGGSGAGFLRMSPGGRLKPHFGNAPRLSVHLGLIVPDGEIRMSVGYESVRWQEGKVIVFDDTFIHQVVHNGVEPRYVMNVWMCHPCEANDGKLPGESVPAHCQGMVGSMTALGLQPLPPRT